MKTRWTPGPWLHVAIEGGWDGVAAADKTPICSLSYNNPANATLIAGAPELFDALAEILDVINANDGDDPDGLVALMESGRAALAKALGEKA